MGLMLAAALWGFAEATLFFLVPDVLLSAVAIRSPRRAILCCLTALVGALIGGIAMFAWAQADPDGAITAVAAVPAIDQALINEVGESLAAQGYLAMILGPLSGTPFKVYAVQAAATDMSFWAFVFAAIPARLPRFLLVAGFAGLCGRAIVTRFGFSVAYATWTATWVCFYVFYFAAMA